MARPGLDHHDALIRQMAADGRCDREIAHAVGAGKKGVEAYRRRHRIAGLPRGGRKGMARPAAGAATLPREAFSPVAQDRALREALAEADDLFALCMGEGRFASVAPRPVGRITGRCDPAIALGASSAYTAIGEAPAKAGRT